MKQITLRIVPATSPDVPIILRMIRGLAEYEKLLDACSATEDQLRESLFGAHPAAEVLLAWADDRPVGFALFFHNYSTFLAQRGLYLEDLFVLPEWRGHGVGRRLLERLAQIAVDRDCGRLEWTVLDWNTPAIGFYQRLGATSMDDWTIYRLTGEPLRRLASRQP
jgi:GNAT superfamily N-acetyltransferase